MTRVIFIYTGPCMWGYTYVCVCSRVVKGVGFKSPCICFAGSNPAARTKAFITIDANNIMIIRVCYHIMIASACLRMFPSGNIYYIYIGTRITYAIAYVPERSKGRDLSPRTYVSQVRILPYARKHIYPYM